MTALAADRRRGLLERRRGSNMDPMLKSVAEKGLLASGLPHLTRRFRSDQAIVLSYHNVVPDHYPRTGDVSLHLPLSVFRSQLDRLGETHQVIGLGDLFQGTWRRGRPAAAITFDDAYAGALDIGIAEVVARAMPATVFVSPGLLDSSGFWWDLLADPISGGLDSRLRRRALTELAGRQEPVLAWAREQGLSTVELPDLVRPADRKKVARAAEEPGVTLGSHTWSHPNLVGLSADTLRYEMERSRTWLEEQFPASYVSWLAYPYGLHDGEARTTVALTGYCGGLTGTSGWSKMPPGDPYSVPRLNVPARLSEAGFLLRVSGVPIL